MRIKNLLLLALFSCLLVTLISGRGSIENKLFMESKTNEDTLIIEAKVVKVTFVNKGGREYPDIYDLFLKTDDDKLFIKFSEGNVLSDDIEKYMDQLIRLKVIKRTGLWDTDNPEVQSRVGDYLVILEILH